MVEYGHTSPPYQALATSPFTQDARNQDTPEDMPKSEGRTSMAKPLWNILQNKAAKVVDHGSTTMQDSNRIMQKEGWTKENDCDTSASQLREYGANNILFHFWQSHFSDHLHWLESVNQCMRLLKHPRQAMPFNLWSRILFHPR
jgi:hypothetical protein